jgi:hypothetical protein
MDPDPDPAIFVIDPQDANKKLIKKNLSAFSRDKKSKGTHKTVGIKDFRTIFAC